MPTDTDVERRLRGVLLAHAGSDGLPDHVLADALAQGRSAVRRRRRMVAAGAVASFALVAGIAIAAIGAGDAQPRPAPAPPGPLPTAGAGTTTSPDDWARSLPRGPAVEVPYLSGTTLVEPDGSRVEIPGTEASFVGMSAVGPVLLVGTEEQDPYSFSTRYVLVRANGQPEDLPVPTASPGGAEEALVSPDGTRLATGAGVLDLTDMSVVGRVPDDAKILLAWTPVGIVYFADDGRYVLWAEDGTPVDLRSNPGVFAAGSDVAVDQCGTITRLAADGTLSRLSPHCVLGAWSVAPNGRWALTADWQLVAVTTGASRSLTDRPVLNSDRTASVWWDGDNVTIPAGQYLVRCEVRTATCQRVAGPEQKPALP